MPMRRARLGDLAALLALENECFATDRMSRASLRYYISAPRAALIVCERAGNLVGYCLMACRKGSDKAWLHSLAVRPADRGHRFGSALLKAAETAAREQGASSLHLEVRSRNRRAIGLYESRHFRRINTIADYYEDGASALCFAKRLRASDLKVGTGFGKNPMLN